MHNKCSSTRSAADVVDLVDVSNVINILDVIYVVNVAAGVTLLPLGFASQNPSNGTINHEIKNYKNNSSHRSLIKPLYNRYSRCCRCSSRGNVVTPRFCFSKP